MCLTVVLLFCSVNIEEFQVFLNHLVVLERLEGLPKLVVYDLPPIGQPLKDLGLGQPVDFVDPVYSAYLLDSQFSSNILRFSYSSLRTPPSVYDYDMETGERVLKKTEAVSL